MDKGHKFTTVDEYIAQFPAEHQKVLQQLRAMIKADVPEATEYIGYNMPAYKYNGPLVYFAGYKGHLGFYPTNSGIVAFADRIQALGYPMSKGTVQLPWGEPLPQALIREIVRYRMAENQAKRNKK